MEGTFLLVTSFIACIWPLIVLCAVCPENKIDLFLAVDSIDAELIREETSFQMMAAQRVVNLASDVGDPSGATRVAFFSGFKDNRPENLLQSKIMEWSPVALKHIESICNDIQKNHKSYKTLSVEDAVKWYERVFKGAGNKFQRKNSEAEQVLLILYSTSVLRSLNDEMNFKQQASSLGLTVHAIRFLSKADKLGYKYGTEDADLVIRRSEIQQFFFGGGLENFVQEKICHKKCLYNKLDHITKCRYSFEAKRCQAETHFEPTTESKKLSECKPYSEAYACELEQCCPEIHSEWSAWECVLDPCGTTRSTRTRYLSNTTLIQRLYDYNKTEHRHMLDCPLEEYREDQQCLKVSMCMEEEYCTMDDPSRDTNLIMGIIFAVSVLIDLILISLAIKRRKDDQNSDRSRAKPKNSESSRAPETKQLQKSPSKQNGTPT